MRLVVVPQCLIDEVVLYTDAWVELILILTVAHEEHVADQCVETVAEVGQFGVVGLGGGLVPCLYLALRVVCGLHGPDVVVLVVEEGVLHVLCLFAEDLLQRPVGNERLGEEVLLELQAVGLNLLTRHAE